MFVRRTAIEHVGLLDERYGMYFEDLDWCLRSKRAGWKVLYDGRVSVMHVKGATSVVERGRARHRGPRLDVAFHRSIGRFYRTSRGGSNVALDSLVYVVLAGKLLVSITRSAIARRGFR